jgi:pimeloyl-ACP methyl ester carboxylesterase
VARDTKNCVDEFRARHGGGACSTPNGEALTKGLDFLDAFDIRRFAGLDCFASLAMTAEPMADKRSTLVLASEDDPLVPLDAGRELAQIGGDLFVSATGGHGLPLRAPGFCAEKIGDFLRRHGW